MGRQAASRDIGNFAERTAVGTRAGMAHQVRSGCSGPMSCWLLTLGSTSRGHDSPC